MRLLAVELNRFRSRRAIALLMLASVLLAVVLAGVTAWHTRPLTQADRTDAAAQADLEGQRRRSSSRSRACRAEPRELPRPVGRPPRSARTRWSPDPEAYYPRDPLSLRKALSTGRARVCRWPWSWSA